MLNSIKRGFRWMMGADGAEGTDTQHDHLLSAETGTYGTVSEGLNPPSNIESANPLTQLVENPTYQKGMAVQRASAGLFLIFASMIFDMLWQPTTSSEREHWWVNMAGYFGSILVATAATFGLTQWKEFDFTKTAIETEERMLYLFTIMLDIMSYAEGKQINDTTSKIMLSTLPLVASVLISWFKIDEAELKNSDQYSKLEHVCARLSRICNRGAALAMPASIVQSLQNNPTQHLVSKMSAGALGTAIIAEIIDIISHSEAARKTSSAIFDALIDPLNVSMLAFSLINSGFAIITDSESVPLWFMLVTSLTYDAFSLATHMWSAKNEWQEEAQAIAEHTEASTDAEEEAQAPLQTWCQYFTSFLKRQTDEAPDTGTQMSNNTNPSDGCTLPYHSV